MNVREIREFIRTENEAMRAAQSVPLPTPRKLTPEEMAAIGMPRPDMAQMDDEPPALGLIAYVLFGAGAVFGLGFGSLLWMWGQ